MSRPVVPADATARAEMQQANSLITQGNTTSALPIVRRLLQREPNLAGAHFLMGRIHLRQGNREQGLAAATRAWQLDPKAAFTKLLLGEIYVDLRLPEYALDILQQACRQVPEDHAANFQLGRCYLTMQKGHLASPHLEKALAAARTPMEKIGASLALAECLSSVSEGAAADAVIDGLIRNYPQVPEPLFFRGSSVSKPVPQWLPEMLEAASNNPKLDAEDRANALLGLGRCHDVEGRHDLAFEMWSQSRALLGVQQHEPGQLMRRSALIRSFYPRDMLERLSSHGNQTDSPIFIVGMPRSGTTLTAQVIGAHPACINVGETDRIARHDALFRDQYTGPHSGDKMQADAEAGALRTIADEFTRFFSVFAEGSKSRPVEKTPANYDHLGFIRLVFPKARIVHCRRHPADNFISCFQHNMNRGHDYAYDQTAFAERYLAQEEMMRYWTSCFPEQIFELRYEDMVADQENMTRKLVAFCGLPWDEACLNFHAQKSTVRTFSRDQVRKPLYATSVGRWRRYGNHLDTLFATLEKHGYHGATDRPEESRLATHHEH
jgi:Tfp pilus assembly protein PilF